MKSRRARFSTGYASGGWISVRGVFRGYVSYLLTQTAWIVHHWSHIQQTGLRHRTPSSGSFLACATLYSLDTFWNPAVEFFRLVASFRD